MLPKLISSAPCSLDILAPCSWLPGCFGHHSPGSLKPLTGSHLCGFSQKSLKVILQVNLALCQTHCKQAPAISRPFWCLSVSQMIHMYHTSSSYLQVNIGCALIILFQAHSFNVLKIGRPPFMGSNLGVPSLGQIHFMHFSIEARVTTTWKEVARLLYSWSWPLCTWQIAAQQFCYLTIFQNLRDNFLTKWPRVSKLYLHLQGDL